SAPPPPGPRPAHFSTLRPAWSGEPERRLADLPLLTAPERHQLLVEWNPRPAAAAEALIPLHRLFEAPADRAAAHVARSMGDERLTYAELDRRANRLARHLQAAGVRP